MMEEESERRCVRTDEVEVWKLCLKGQNRGAILDVDDRGRRARWGRAEEDGNEEGDLSGSLDWQRVKLCPRNQW
jgi:hypothetical protein